MRRSIGSMVLVAAVVACLFSLTMLATAQSDAVRAIYASAANIPTKIPGIHTYATPAKNFSPLTATDEELATYGFPPRPNQQTDAAAYKLWARAMAAAKNRSTKELKALPYSSRELMSGKPLTTSTSASPSQWTSSNWSGVANTNKNKSWSSKTSFDEVVSIFNVPVAQPPFGACGNGIDGPFYQVSWNGIDGFSNGDVLQGGSLSAADCEGDTLYEAWVEWYPSYSIVPVFYVNPGDDIYVVTYDYSGGTNPGSVFVEDFTTLTYNTFSLSWLSGPGLVGNSAEYIVERPCCNGDGYPLALANYIYNFWTDSFAYEGNGKLFYPGSTSTSTANITMYDDAFDQPISSVEGVGATGFEGRYSLWFSDDDCAYSGGCTSF
ncbi:MAG: G1 family glutamic endopeptidase [Terriglobales bacterium]